MKVCSTEGCAFRAASRGMCEKHYNAWLHQMNKQGVFFSLPPFIEWLKAPGVLPGSIDQIAERIQMHFNSVHKAMRPLYKDGTVFVSDYLPPQGGGKDGRGGQWTKVYSFGPGEDKVLDPAVKLKYAADISRVRKLEWKRAKKLKQSC